MGRNTRRRLLISTVAALLSLQAVPAVHACPNCKVNVEDASKAPADADGTDSGDTSPRANMAAGYYYSILFMMPLPFILLSGLLVVIRRQARRDAARHAECYDPSSRQ